MPNVYVEPEPKGREEGTAIDHYVLEFGGGQRADQNNYKTQATRVKAARKLGHHPLVARVRSTDKGNPDHWRSV